MNEKMNKQWKDLDGIPDHTVLTLMAKVLRGQKFCPTGQQKKTWVLVMWLAVPYPYWEQAVKTAETI